MNALDTSPSRVRWGLSLFSSLFIATPFMGALSRKTLGMINAGYAAFGTTCAFVVCGLVIAQLFVTVSPVIATTFAGVALWYLLNTITTAFWIIPLTKR